MAAPRDFKDLTHNARHEHHPASRVGMAAEGRLAARFQLVNHSRSGPGGTREDYKRPRHLYEFYTKCGRTRAARSGRDMDKSLAIHAPRADRASVKNRAAALLNSASSRSVSGTATCS